MNLLTHDQIAALTALLETTPDFVFCETSRLTAQESQSLLFLEPKEWLTCATAEQVSAFFQQAEELRAQGFFLAGWFDYEFSYLLEPALQHLRNREEKNPADPKPLAVLGVFDRPYIFDHGRGAFAANRPWPEATAAEQGYELSGLTTNLTREEYLRSIAKLKEYLAAGDTYQVNYTLKLHFGFSGSLAALYLALRRNQSVSYSAWIRHGGGDILSFSPELFFRAEPGSIMVKPMKGTMKRGRTVAEDEQLRSLLATDRKNRSENVMIVDLLRNDLGQLLHRTGGGQVVPQTLFEVETYETLLQMTSTIRGQSASPRPLPLLEVMRSLFPCGSVTGAPKIRTMEIIAELEKEPRGVYCGAIGYCSPEKAVFNVPIRTVTIVGHRGEMGIGSGIIHECDPESEWRECLLKGTFLSEPRPDFELFETMLWQPAQGYWLREYHLERLAESAGFFLFFLDLAAISAALSREECAFREDGATRRVRLALRRDGHFTLTIARIEPPTLLTDPLLALHTLPPQPVVLSAQPTDPAEVYLFHKTTQRHLYNAHYQRIQDQGYYEVLFCNLQGELTEGSISNVFLLKEGQLVTPPLACGLLAGTFRRHLLALGQVREEVVRKDELLAAPALFIGNSVRGLIPVRLVDI